MGRSLPHTFTTGEGQGPPIGATEAPMRLLASNIQNVGTITRCKQARLTSKLHETILIDDSESRPALEQPGGGFAASETGVVALDILLRRLSADVESRGHNESYGKQSGTTECPSDWTGLDCNYQGLEKALNEYNTTYDLGRSSKSFLVKKMVITGGPKPINRLKDKEQSSLTKFGRKSFNSIKGPFTFEGEGSYSPPPLKKQKLDPEKQEQGKIPFGNNINDEIDESHPGSGFRKRTRGNGYPQYNIPLSGGVDEFQRVEAIMGFDKSLKNTVQKKTQSLQTQNGLGLSSSMRSSVERRGFDPSPPPNHVILDDDDSIEEVSSQPNQRYGGTASRQRQNRIINGCENKIDSELASAASERSRFFPDSSRHGSRNNIGSAQIIPGSESDVEETLKVSTKSSTNELGNPSSASSDYDDLDPLNSDLLFPWSRTNNGKARFGSTKETLRKHPPAKSASITRRGDIPPSSFAGIQYGKPRRKATQDVLTDASFNVTSICDGSAVLSSDQQLIQFRLNQDTKDFDIVIEGNSVSDLYPTMVLKPRKIHKVWYNKESIKVIIFRATEESIRSAHKLLIRMKQTIDGENFRIAMVQMNSLIKLEELPRDHLFQVFEKQSEKARKAHDKSHILIRDSEPRKVKSQNANIVARGGTLEIVESMDSPQQQDITVDTSVLKPQKSKPLFEKPAGKSLVKLLPVLSRLSPQLASETEPPDLIEDDNRRPSYLRSRPETRFSSRLQSLDAIRKQETAISIPLGWTRQNPTWRETRGWTSSLVYPAEGPKKATVDAVDIDRLDEGEFLNDNLIEFYLRYLETNLQKNDPEIAKRIYFQNTFFYQTLTKGKARGNSINYDAVKRWTTKVDIFSFDYIIVPVCEKAHWYVAIICNAPRLLQPWKDKDDESEAETRGDTDLSPSQRRQKATSEILMPAGTEIDSPESEKTIDPTKERSRSPSVTAKVKDLSLDEDVDDNGLPVLSHNPGKLPTVIAQFPDADEPTNLDELFSESPRYEDEQSLQSSVMMENLFKGRKGKRKSIPPARTYDPSQPRIITLDSLGGSHSPTCSNLQKYLVCEAMAKRHVNITIERLGMTAKGLPLQDNFCDCGIFVLGYIERFLKDPDLFVHDILSGKMTSESGWVKFNAPEMRISIRGLLFKLHDEQSKRETQLRTAKLKAKRLSRLELVEDPDEPTDKESDAASKALPQAPTPVISSLVSEDPGVTESVAKAKDDSDEIRQGIPGYPEWINDTPTNGVSEHLCLNMGSLTERKMKRSKSDVEESEIPRHSVRNGLVGIRRAGFKKCPVDIPDIPSSGRASPLRQSPQLQSSPGLGTPLIPKGRFRTPRSPKSEAPAVSNIFKQYARTRPRLVDHSTLHAAEQTEISQDDYVVIRSPSDEVSELPPQSLQVVDASDKDMDTPELPSKRIRTERFLDDIATDFLSTTSTNSVEEKPLFSSSPKTSARASPRATRTSPRNHFSRKFLRQDQEGQFLSRRERQAQGTWTQKKRGPI